MCMVANRPSLFMFLFSVYISVILLPYCSACIIGEQIYVVNIVISQHLAFDVYPRVALHSASIAVVACLSVCHTPVLYRNG